MDEQAVETSGKSSSRRTIFRLLGAFLPQTHVFIAAMAMTVLYTGLMTARVALIYPALRVFVQNMDEDEIASSGMAKQVKHLLTDDDSQFSKTSSALPFPRRSRTIRRKRRSSPHSSR